MQCPVDTTDLVMRDCQGAGIDYYPKCRGVWLDRGEMDKIIEREATQSLATHTPQDSQAPSYPPQQYDKHGRQVRNSQGYPRKKRRESFPRDIFDF